MNILKKNGKNHLELIYYIKELVILGIDLFFYLHRNLHFFFLKRKKKKNNKDNKKDKSDKDKSIESNLKDNNSRNQLNEVDNRINNKNSITKYKVTKISIGDANMLIGTQDDYKNTDEHGN